MDLDTLKARAAHALDAMAAAGFDAAQVNLSVSAQSELNLNHDAPSLLRSTEDHDLALLGIVGGRKASVALTDLAEGSITAAAQALIERAKLAPVDEANAVSSEQSGHFEQGPQAPDLDLLADKVAELLAFRAAETPSMHLEEGAASHAVGSEVLATSAGTLLTSSIGSYALSAMGTASDGERSSSFNYTGGTSNDLAGKHAAEWFAIGQMLRDTERQIVTQPIGFQGQGEVVLAPTAVSDLVDWLLGQLGDFALIAEQSLYRKRVGEVIGSPLLTLGTRIDAPGYAGYTGDGFIAPPRTVLDAGRLTTLLPSLYGSRKTGEPHVPVTGAWVLAPGETPLEELIGGVERGALVSRFSMGSPAANGDFSGVIKNSFRIDGGSLGPALAETMVAGNMARMLEDVVAVSREHLDSGGEDFPWVRVKGLNFS